MKLIIDRFTSRRPANRAFTIVAVLFSFLVLGAAVSALALLFTTENRRTMGALNGTQLRQLLLASAPAATDELNQHGSTARDVALATPLPEAKVTMAIKPEGSDKAQVRVEALMGRSMASQALRYVRSGKNWTLESASLIADGSNVSDFHPRATPAAAPAALPEKP